MARHHGAALAPLAPAPLTAVPCPLGLVDSEDDGSKDSALRMAKVHLPAIEKMLQGPALSKAIGLVGACSRARRAIGLAGLMGDDAVGACIATTLGLLRGKARVLIQKLRQSSSVWGQADAAVGAGPCSNIVSTTQLSSNVREACAQELEDLWARTAGGTAIGPTSSRRANAAWLLARIGETVPEIGRELLEVSRSTDLRLLAPACSPQRLEYCFEIFRHCNVTGAGSLMLRNTGAQVLAKSLLQQVGVDPSDPEFANLQLLAPTLVAAMAEWYGATCRSSDAGEACSRVLSLVPGLCFSISAPMLDEVCDSAFAIFALSGSGGA